MTQKIHNSEIILAEHHFAEEVSVQELEQKQAAERTAKSIKLLWNQRMFLFRVMAMGLVCSAVIAFLIPSRYTSTTRLMPPDNQSSGGFAMAAAALAGRAGGLADVAGDFLGLKSNSDLFVGILSSRTAQDELINQFDLKKVYWARRMDDARKDLASNTSISVDRKSQIISISVTDHSAQRAQAMAQAYVEELNRLVTELSTSSARRERLFLEGRLQNVSQDLEKAEKDFSEFSSKNTAIDIKEQGKAMVEAAATLQGQLIAAEAELEGVRQIYAETDIHVRALNARIKELRHQLEKLGGKDENGSAPTNSGTDLYPSIRKLPVLGVTYADLYRRTRVQEAVYEALTQQYEIARVEEAKEIPTVKVLDAAEMPEKKSFPPRMVIVFLGTCFTFAAAAVFILGSEKWNTMDPQHPGKALASNIWSEFKEQGLWHGVNGSQNGNSTQRLSEQEQMHK